MAQVMMAQIMMAQSIGRLVLLFYLCGRLVSQPGRIWMVSWWDRADGMGCVCLGT